MCDTEKPAGIFALHADISNMLLCLFEACEDVKELAEEMLRNPLLAPDVSRFIKIVEPALLKATGRLEK